MKLYHASQYEIPDPDIRHGRKNADFGQGFYLTPEREFACRWAGDGFVLNEYELDLSDLKVHRFGRDAGWFEYIFHNRRSQDDLPADVIIGPVANDTIYETFGVISSGFLEPEEALRLLLIGPEYTQVAVKSEKAARQLRWIGAAPIDRIWDYRKLLKEEEEEYQKAFAEEIVRQD